MKKAGKYVQGTWNKLRRFLAQPGEVMERQIKKEVLQAAVFKDLSGNERVVQLFSFGGGEDRSEGGTREVQLSTEYIQTVYCEMFPDDPSMDKMDTERSKIIGHYFIEMKGNLPFMITSTIKKGLMNFGYSLAEIDKMTPLRAHSLLFKHRFNEKKEKDDEEDD